MKTKVIYGAPCSGKSTYVRNNIGKKDIVYDYDAIARAITFTDKHLLSKRAHVHNFVVGFRFSMINRLLKESEKGIEVAWIIKGNIDKKFKELLSPLDPEYIKMDVTKEECYKRLEADNDRPDKKEWKEKIDLWFSNHEGENKKMSKMQIREQRTMSLPLSIIGQAGSEKRFDTDYYVEGYATTFEKPYLMYEWDDMKYYEVIGRNALVGADMSDVIMQYDHSGTVYARNKMAAGKPPCLLLEPQESGLFVAADLGVIDEAKSLYASIEAGLVYKMSWAFSVLEDSYNKDTRTRTITKIKKVYDVSAVSYPANDDTDISARSYFNGVIEAERREALAREKQLLLLKTKI